MNEQYYLNNNTLHHCVRIPPKVHDYFLIKNYLSELRTDEEREIARRNLGVTVLLEQLRTLINTKVIEVGGALFDDIPTEGSLNLMRSGAIFNALSKYYTKTQIDQALLEINRAIEGKIDIDVDIITELPSETIGYNQLVTYNGVPVQQVQWLDNLNNVHTTYITLDGYYDYIYNPEDDRELIFNTKYLLGHLPHNLIAALSGIVDIKRYLNEGDVLPKSASYVYLGSPLEVHRVDISEVTFNEGYSENILGFVAFIVRRKITALEIYHKEFPNIFIYKAEWNLSKTIEDVDLVYYKTLTDHSTLDDFDKELVGLLGCTKATHDYGGLMSALDKVNLDYVSENAITKVELNPTPGWSLPIQIQPDRPITYTHNNLPVEYRTYKTINDETEYYWYVFLIATDPLNPICLGYRSTLSDTEPPTDYYCQGYFNKDGSAGMSIIPDWMYSLFHQDTSVEVFDIFTGETEDEYNFASDLDIEDLFEGQINDEQSNENENNSNNLEFAEDEEIQSLFD